MWAKLENVKWFANFKFAGGTPPVQFVQSDGVSVFRLSFSQFRWPARQPDQAEEALSSTASLFPARVLLFSGHMIDRPGRFPPRLPAGRESSAARIIEQALDRLSAGPDDLALTQGACGGDILFAESCLRRGVGLELLQPFEESVFIDNAVAPAGADWVVRYRNIVGRLQCRPLAASFALGPLPYGGNAFHRCNLWLLERALAYGDGKLIFICLWDGADGERPGSSAHMLAEASRLGRAIWLDVRQLNA